MADIVELRKALEALGLPCGEAQTAAVLAKFDADGNLTLELEEFQKLFNAFRTFAEMNAAANDVVSSVKKRGKSSKSLDV